MHHFFIVKPNLSVLFIAPKPSFLLMAFSLTTCLGKMFRVFPFLLHSLVKDDLVIFTFVWYSLK